MRCNRPPTILLNSYFSWMRSEQAELVILVLSYDTSTLFLVMVLRNLAKTRLASLNYTYNVKVIALITWQGVKFTDRKLSVDVLFTYQKSFPFDRIQNEHISLSFPGCIGLQGLAFSNYRRLRSWRRGLLHSACCANVVDCLGVIIGSSVTMHPREMSAPWVWFDTVSKQNEAVSSQLRL